MKQIHTNKMYNKNSSNLRIILGIMYHGLEYLIRHACLVACTGWDPFGWGYYLCCKVDISPGQKLAYTFQLVGAMYMCNELRVIWPVPHEILSVITRSTIIT